MWRPAVLGPSAVATLGSLVLFAFVGTGEFWNLPTGAMLMVVLGMAARFWVGLTVSWTALTIMRGGFRWRPTSIVAATTAFQAATVSIGLAVPIMAGVLFLVVPGIVVAVAWSQAAMLILDKEAEWFDAAATSWDLTRGRRTAILLVWLMTGGVLAVAGWLLPALSEMASVLGVPSFPLRIVDWAARIVADVFSLSVMAALYHELTVFPEVAAP